SLYTFASIPISKSDLQLSSILKFYQRAWDQMPGFIRPLYAALSDLHMAMAAAGLMTESELYEIQHKKRRR
ncbi:MAG TPA: hypothetical protein VN455_12335, partial [Methanotrichaceae archaeon]|nr:hypothetical protein [Methanotrichaceae archaeon]